MALGPIQKTGRYEQIPPGSIFTVQLAMPVGAGPALITLIDADPNTQDVPGAGNNVRKSITVSRPGCFARVQIPIVANTVGTVTYQVTDAAGQLLRPPVVHLLGTTADPLQAPTSYSGLFLVRT